MKTIFLLFFLVLSLCAGTLPVPQGRFDTGPGFLTRNINDSPYTNYFALRPSSTNYVQVSDNTNWFSSVEQNWVVTNKTVTGIDYNGLNVEVVRTQAVVALSPGSGSFTMSLTNLWPGVYGVQVFGVVTNQLASAFRLPLIWRVVANDRADGGTNIYHVIQNYQPNTNCDIGQFWIQAVRSSGPSNDITVTVSLSPASEVSAKVVALHFNAPADYSDTNIYKTLPSLYTYDEFSARTNYAQTNTAAGTVLDWKNAGDLSYASADKTNTYQRWVPLNMMGDETSGTYATQRDANWVLHPYRSTIQNTASDYTYPWAWTNIATGQFYSRADFLAGLPLPGTTNDFTGFVYTNGTWYSTYGAGHRYGYYKDYIMPMTMNHFNNNSLLNRFYTFPLQTNVAHIGGLHLASFALSYPTHRMEASDINSNMKNPSAYLDYDLGRWSLRRTGKFEYDGWAGTTEPSAAQAVDWLWPYIATNTAFANDLTLSLPWIEGNTNHVKRHFWNLLMSLYSDEGYRARGGNPMYLGLAMQGGTVASNLMNPAYATLEITPAASASSTWRKHYSSTYVRDGGNLIGSTFYMAGENPLLTGPDLTRRYKALGGLTGAIDISDVAQFPKLAAFAEWYANANMGYGFLASFGDSGRGINDGPGILSPVDDTFLTSLWRINQNARIAKYIVEVRGRSIQTDVEWTAMQAQATATQFDIRYPIESRVFSGIGIGILEQGLGTTNQMQRGGLLLRTVSGSGHAHNDHLDLGIYALGARMGTDLSRRTEGANVVYPRALSTKVHNVVEVDGYNHESTASSGWSPGSGGAYSQTTLFSTNGSAQVIGGQAWYQPAGSSSGNTNVTYQSRESVLVRVDATNSYTVDFQRVDGGKQHSWGFHGADVGGETAGFTTSLAMTNLPLEFTSSSTPNPAYTLRKHATNYGGLMFTGAVPNEVWAQWRLGRTATTATPTNVDGSGVNVTCIAPEQAMYGSAYNAASDRKYMRAVLFDRTNDVAASAWMFSGSYSILQPRLYVFNNVGSNYNALPQQSSVWAAVYEPYIGSRFITSEESLVTDTALTNAFAPKVLRVVAGPYTDYHFSSGTNHTVTVGSSVFNGRYGFVRESNGVVIEIKLVGGTVLTHGGVTVTVATNNLSQFISHVNYSNSLVTLSNAYSGTMRKGWYRFRSDNRESSYYITNWITSSQFQFSGDALTGEVDVTGVSGNTVSVTSDAGAPAWAGYPKMGTGLIAANESHSKNFVASYTSGFVRTGGDSIVTGDFTDYDGDGLISARFYDLGRGYTVEQPSEFLAVKSGGAWTEESNVESDFEGGDTRIVTFGGNVQIQGRSVVIQ